MLRICALLSILGMIGLAFPAHAEPAIAFNTVFLYGKNLSTGEGLPIMNGHGVSGVFALGEGWSGGVEVGFLTTTAKFEPSPLINFFGAKRFSEDFLLGSSLIGRYIPASGDHVISLGLTPTFPVTKGVTVLIPLGPSYNLDKKVWLLGFGAKFNFKIH